MCVCVAALGDIKQSGKANAPEELHLEPCRQNSRCRALPVAGLHNQRRRREGGAAASQKQERAEEKQCPSQECPSQTSASVLFSDCVVNGRG